LLSREDGGQASQLTPPIDDRGDGISTFELSYEYVSLFDLNCRLGADLAGSDSLRFKPLKMVVFLLPSSTYIKFDSAPTPAGSSLAIGILTGESRQKWFT